MNGVQPLDYLAFLIYPALMAGELLDRTSPPEKHHRLLLFARHWPDPTEGVSCHVNYPDCCR